MENDKTINRIHSASSFKVACPFDICDMYNTIEKNYQWESFKYSNPKVYHQAPNQNQSKKRPNTAQKRTYLNELYQITKHVPGVGNYNTTVLPEFKFVRKIKSAERRTFIDNIFITNERCGSPGPGAYLKTEEDKKIVKRNIKKNFQKINYLDEVQYQSSTQPGVGQYNIRTTLLKKSHSAKKNKLLKKKKEVKKTNQQMLNPVVNNTFDQISKAPIKKCSMSKMQRFKTLNQNEKFPSSTFYKINMDWVRDKESSGNCLNNLSKPIPKSIYY